MPNIDTSGEGRSGKKLLFAALFLLVLAGSAVYSLRHRIVLAAAKPLIEFLDDPRNAALLQDEAESRPTALQERYLDLARLTLDLPERVRRPLYRFGRGDEGDRHSPAFDELTEAQWKPLLSALDEAAGKDPKTDPTRYGHGKLMLHGLMIPGAPPVEEPHVVHALRILCGLCRVAAERDLKIHAGVMSLKLLRAACDIMRSDGLGTYRQGALLWMDALAALRDYAWRETNDKHLQRMHTLLDDIEKHAPTQDFPIEQAEKYVTRAVAKFEELFATRVRILNRYYGDTAGYVKRAFREWRMTAFDPWPKAYKAYAQIHLWFRDEPLASTYFARVLFPDMHEATRFFHRRTAMTRITLLCLRLRMTHLMKKRFPEDLEEMPDMLAVNLPSDPYSDNIFGYHADPDGGAFKIYTLGLNSTDDRLREGSDDEVLYEYKALPE